MIDFVRHFPLSGQSGRCKNLAKTFTDCPLNGSATAKNFPTAHSMENAEQNLSFTKHPSVLPTHRLNTILAAVETEFNTRFYNHRQSFNHRDKANATELSKTLWKYKDKGIKPRITWSITCKSFAYTSGTKRCNLCLAEKLAILQADQRTLLNKRSEFVSKCRHRNKFKLKKA